MMKLWDLVHDRSIGKLYRDIFSQVYSTCMTIPILSSIGFPQVRENLRYEYCRPGCAEHAEPANGHRLRFLRYRPATSKGSRP